MSHEQTAAAQGCPTPGKRRYQTRKHAKRHLRRMAGDGLPTHGLRAYRCVCGVFHLGRLERQAIAEGRANLYERLRGDRRHPAARKDAA